MDARTEQWFRTRMTTRSDWRRDELAAVKGDQTVSVVLPARDEAATVGGIVGSLRRELVERVPLVDEVLVVDSGSRDATAHVARAAGARVVSQAGLAPHLPDVPGKGEALWKSLNGARGDLLVFIDADLRDFDPQFVVGLLGPLLTEPGTGFVKALYERPLRLAAGIAPSGGGRVTELVARPLLALYWPALAGFVQPLAGEYAIRRSLAEQLPFCSGYGVDIGLLIDVYEHWGLAAMAQVDLGRRVHRNQDDAALGRMATQVLLAVQDRLEIYGKAGFVDAPGGTLTQFSLVGDRQEPSYHSVGVVERPPMATVPAYRQRFDPVP